MSGRRHVLTYPNLRAIDLWFAAKGRNKQPPAKVLAHELGVSLRTLWNAAKRRDGYAGIP